MKKGDRNVRRQVLTALMVALLLAFTSAAASAGEFKLGEIKVGGSVSYGTLFITDEYSQWEDSFSRYLSTAPLVAVNASYQLLPRVALLADYSLCIKSLSRSYGVDWDGFDDDFENASYTNLGLAASIKLTDNLSLMAGWTRFTSGYNGLVDIDDDLEPDAVLNSGSGLKVGAALNVPLTDTVSLDARYAFLPRVRYATTVNGEPWEDVYVGPGHEMSANVTYVTPFGLGVSLGFRTELYSGREVYYDDLDIYDYDFASFSGGVVGLSYSF
jgi:hypothetical protein